jgi:YggT family protein
MAILISIVSFAFRLYSFLILIRVILSWLNTDPYRTTLDHPAVHLLYRITDPILRPLQRIIPPIGGAIDISPIAALIILEIARFIVLSILSAL